MVKIPIPLSDTDDWVRMPKPRERLCGLSRTTLLEAISGGHVKSSVIRKAGSKKGIRLVSKISLLAYIESCVETK